MVGQAGGKRGGCIRILLASILSLALMTTGCTKSEQEKVPTPPASETAWQTLVDRIGPQGEISKDLALDAFATLFAPIPQGTRVAGDAGTSSGTGAIFWLLRFWNELSAEQTAVVLRFFGQPSVGLAGSKGLSVSPADRLDQLQKMTDRVEQELRTQHPEFDPLNPISVGFMEEPPADKSVLAVALPYRDGKLVGSGLVDMCFITFPPNIGDNLQRIDSGDRNALVSLESTIAHELMHCHQMNLVKNRVHALVYSPDWVHEGSAQWGAFHVPSRTTAPQPLDDHWIPYFAEPTTDLFRRQYDAVGFWSYVSDVWKTQELAFAKPWSDANAPALSQELLDAVRLDQKLWRLGTSYSRFPGFGTEWETVGPGLVSRDQDHRPPPAESLNLAPDQSITRQIPLRAFGAAKITFSDNVDVVVFSPAASGALHWGEGDAGPDDIFESVDERMEFCVSPNGCVCPPGMQRRPDSLLSDRKFNTVTLSAFGEFSGPHESPTGQRIDPHFVMEASAMETVASKYCIPEETIDFTHCESWFDGAELMTLVPGSTRVFNRTFEPINDNENGITLCSWVAQKNSVQEPEPFYDWAVDIDMGIKLRKDMPQVQWDQWYARYTARMDCSKFSLTDQIPACTEEGQTSHKIVAEIGDAVMFVFAGASITGNNLDIPRDKLINDTREVARAFAKKLGS